MKDLKYLAAYTIPFFTFLSINLKGFYSFGTLVFAFIFVPILEELFPQDRSNLSKNDANLKSFNAIFDWLLYLNVPLVFGILFYALYTVNTAELKIYECIGIIISLGVMLGINGINVAHELGHRQHTKERYIGKLLLLPSNYMHFYIEHNFGHHRLAATKEDPATANYNQTIYSFWLTSTFKQYFDAWALQKMLLRSRKASFLSLNNDMLWYTIFQLCYQLTIFLFFGWNGLLISIFAGMCGILLLETVNYIEHYGLLRSKAESGRYERVSNKHSWNSNHTLGRIILYELTRHSDHHFKTSKKYQVLDSQDDSPQMPYGYPTSMLISLIPPLWFKIMNKRVPKEMIANFKAH